MVNSNIPRPRVGPFEFKAFLGSLKSRLSLMYFREPSIQCIWSESADEIKLLTVL
jgi:hypothetical protein